MRGFHATSGVMKQIMTVLALFVVATLGWIAWHVVEARPVDTTAPEVFEGDGRLVDYCAMAELDGEGEMARDIPRAYTPQCGWEAFPMPVLASCREPLSTGAMDLRGLWQSEDGRHIERIEQCGNRVVITSTGVIHDMIADGTLANGVNDVTARGCAHVQVAARFTSEGALALRPFLGPTIVTRRIEGEKLVWKHPAVGEIKLDRLCQHPGAPQDDDEAP